MLTTAVNIQCIKFLDIRDPQTPENSHMREILQMRKVKAYRKTQILKIISADPGKKPYIWDGLCQELQNAVILIC